MLALAIGGCTGSGTRVSEQQAGQFEKGKTTRAAVILSLGQPSQSTALPDGSSTISYVYVAPAMDARNVAQLATGSSNKTETTTFTFDKAGLLTGYTSDAVKPDPVPTPKNAGDASHFSGM